MHMFVKTVLFQLIKGFSGRAATGCRPSVVYRTCKDQSQAVSEAFRQKIVSHLLIHACYSIWPHHCCGPEHTYMTSQLQSTSSGDQWEDKRALRTPPPRCVFAQVYV